MQIDVSDILRKGEGAQADVTVADATPDLAGISLATPLAGTVRIIGLDDGVVADGHLYAAVTLECDRCLRAFSHDLEFPLTAEFHRVVATNQLPAESFPIDKYGNIDLTEPVRQEIEVQLPLVALCQEDCGGIELKQKKDS